MGSEKEIRWLRGLPVQAFAKGQIDHENGIIKDVVMVEEGEAKGHEVHLESEFIADLVAYDQKYFSSRGVPARFGHPGASDNTMGMQMGFYKNVRKRKGDQGQMQAIADLHLLDAAEVSPTRPNMKSYVLQMAEEAPDFIMSSIVFMPGKYYQRKGNGHKNYVASPWSADPEMGNVFVEFGEDGRHFFTDLVDQGAATNNLFSAQSNPHLFVSQAELFLADNPQLAQFIIANPAKVLEFLTGIGMKTPTQEPKPSTINMSKLFEFLTGKSTVAPEGTDPNEMAQLQSDFAAARVEITNLKAAQKAAEDKVTSLTAELTTATGKVTSLTAELATATERVKELEKEPAEKPTTGRTAPAEGSEEKAYMRSPITQKAKARFKEVE